MLGTLNPSAVILRRTGDGEGGDDLLSEPCMGGGGRLHAMHGVWAVGRACAAARRRGRWRRVAIRGDDVPCAT